MLSPQIKPEKENKLQSGSRKQNRTIEDNKKIGFTKYAETLNGRLAMIGFIVLLTIASLTKHGVISLVINK